MKQLLRYMIGILGALCVWVMMFGFEGSQQAYAETTSVCTTTSDAGCKDYCALDGNKDTNICDQWRKSVKLSDTLELANTLDQLLSVLYLLMWPLMYVAGLAMDNNLIYGEGLGLTGLLYQFWTVMRTIANFMIVFILVWTIGKEMRSPSKLPAALGKTLGSIMLAGVLINASRFLIGAMVDVSTIATYGVGALPLKLESSSDKYCNADGSMGKDGKVESMDDIAKLGNCRPILSANTTINFSDTLSSNKSKRQAFYTYDAKFKDPKKYYFLACPFKNNTITKVERDTTITSFKLTGDDTKAYKEAQANISKDYCVIGTQLLKLDGLTTLTIGATGRDTKVIGGTQDLHSWGGQRVRTLVDGNKNMIGVMYNLYGNMLGFANIKNDIQTATTESQIIQFMIKLFFGFAMLFPMIALCVVLMMRVAVLWMVVGFSPLLVLGWTLDKMDIKNDQLKSITDGIGKNLTLKNVVSLLFQPVIIVFVISMGMMFLDALSSSMATNQSFGDALQCNKTDQCCSIIGVVDICLEKFNATNGVDAFFSFFTFSIVNIVGVMLLYFMVFAVMKSSEITKDATDKIQGLGRNLMGSMPVIPWFGGMVGYDGAKAGLDSARNTVTKKYEDKTGDTIAKPAITRISDQLTGKVSAAQGAVSKSLDSITTDEISKDVSKRSDAGKKLISEIDKQSKTTVKQETADTLVNKSDPKIQALFDAYELKGSDRTMVNLLSNPKFIADTSGKSEDLAMTFAAGNSDWVDHAKGKQAYFAALDKQIKGDIISGSRENGKIAIDGTNGKKKLFTTLFEKKDGKITNIKLEPYGQLGLEIKSSGSYMYEDVSMLDGQLTEKELKAYVGLTSNTPTSDKDGWEISKKEGTDLVNIIKKEKPKTASTPVDPIKK